ncbi:hypothetical protein [Halarchaeum nitratireducens]|uniref:Uncharacterized protein n=1 Tax=Halarchaeum nitratireducens TaxID=489913 RepID=A0A830G6T8_9EURY|nr:hypothetical protein [Halarchaeum nitratireducens]GGN07583.1 hypothetical protein GCM10009021_03480 [Halarchaeum nitratireducens]
MPARRTVFAVVLVVFALAVGGAAVLFWNFTQPVEESYTHEYEYRASVTPNATLTNATLYLPVPAEANGTRVGAAVVDPRSVPNASVTRDATLSYALVDTPAGPMLAVDAARIPAKTRTAPDPTPLPTSDGPASDGPTTTADPAPAPGNHSVTDPYTVTVTLRTNHPIDTRSPVGDEPVLVPRRNAVEVSCDDPGAGDATCRNVESAVYADYDAPANASVEVFVSLTGSNWWFAGGWTGNEYHQYGSVDLTGSQDGWASMNVTERVGFGTYR